MIAPPLVAWITIRFGWRVRLHLHRGSRAGLGGGVSDLPNTAIPRWRQPSARRKTAGDRVRWVDLLGYRQTWAPFVCRFLADPLWYFYVFWIPEFLTRERGLNLAAIGAVAWIPFLVADLSNFAGGYVSLRLQRAGWSANRTRKTMMVIATVLSPVGILAVVRALALLDHRADLHRDLLLDVVVDRRPQPPRGLLPAARGRLGVRHCRHRFDRRLGDQHVGGRPHARRDPQLRAGVHRHRPADADRAGRRICVDEEGRARRSGWPDDAGQPWTPESVSPRRWPSSPRLSHGPAVRASRSRDAASRSRRCRGSEAADQVPGNGHHLVGEAFASGCIAKPHALREHECSDAGSETERQSPRPRRRERVVGAVAEEIARERGAMQCRTLGTGRSAMCAPRVSARSPSTSIRGASERHRPGDLMHSRDRESPDHAGQGGIPKSKFFAHAGLAATSVPARPWVSA